MPGTRTEGILVGDWGAGGARSGNDEPGHRSSKWMTGEPGGGCLGTWEPWQASLRRISRTGSVVEEEGDGWMMEWMDGRMDERVRSGRDVRVQEKRSG